MEYSQILMQISWYVLCFAIGAVIERFYLQYDQIIFRTCEKMVIKMKKLENVFSLSVIVFFLVIILVFIFVFFRDSITIYNTYFNFGLTFLLVAINYLLVSETKKMRQAQNQPNVYVATQPVDELNNIMELFIHNIGLGPAYNVEFIDPPLFQYSEGEFLSDVYLIENKIDFLAPNQKMQIFMMRSSQVFSLNSDDPINMKIKYNDNDKIEYYRDYKIDFNIVVKVKRMRGLTTFENLISKNSAEINKSLSDISSNLKTIANNSISSKEVSTSTGVSKSDNFELLISEENVNKQFEIAKIMVKKVLTEFLNDWKSYSKSNEFLNNEDAEYIEFVAINNRLDYHLFQFTLVSNEIDTAGILPDIVSNKLIEFVAKMRVIESKSDIVSSDAWSREYPSSIPNQFDELLTDIKKMHENLDEICSAS